MSKSKKFWINSSTFILLLVRRDVTAWVSLAFHSSCIISIISDCSSKVVFGVWSSLGSGGPCMGVFLSKEYSVYRLIGYVLIYFFY